MSVINPDLIFGNALTYTADDIVSKLNFPSITKKMVDRLNQLVLVRETFTPDGSAFGTLYYTGSIVGFTYEQIVNIEKVEDITLLADEVSQGVNRIKELITQPSQNDTELSSSLPTLKEKLKANNTSSAIDNISADINTLNDSLKQFNSFLGTYTSEAQQFLDIINKVNQIASSSLGGTLRQGVYNITYQSNPYKVTTNTTLNTNQIFLTSPDFNTIDQELNNLGIVTNQPVSQSTELIIQQTTLPPPPLPTPIPVSEKDKALNDQRIAFQNELDKLNNSYIIDKKIGKIVDDPKTTNKDELKEAYDKELINLNKKNDDKIKDIEKKYPNTTLPPTTTTQTPPNPNNSTTPPGGEQGIKDFQDWLDKKGYKWTSKKGQLNKGSGYGKSGPSTEAAWKTYGNDFLKEKSPTTPIPTLTPEEQAIVNDLTPVPTRSSTSNFGNILNPTSLPSSGNPAITEFNFSSTINPQTNYSDEYIISVYKLTSNKNVQTTIASSTLSPTTIVFSRNKNQLNTNTPNQGYDNTKDITNLKDFISQNKIKNITCVNLWSFPKESIPTVTLKGKIISSKTGEGLGNAKVKFKPLISAETRARLEQFINNSGVGSIITQGQQSINDIVTSYNSVTGSIQSFFPSTNPTGSSN
jgi:hypothetical protein